MNHKLHSHRLMIRFAMVAASLQLAGIALGDETPAPQAQPTVAAAAAPDAAPEAAPKTGGQWTIRGHLTADQVVIQSHRGAGKLAPDNTLAAMELGWKLGTYPECDVRTTKDGVIVAFHDADLSKVATGVDAATRRKSIGELTWEQVSALDVGSWRGTEFKGAPVPRISDLFAAMTGHPERHLYLDIKDVNLERLAEQVRAAHVQQQVILASTVYDIILQWKSLVPESGTLLWMGGSEETLRSRINGLRITNFSGITQLQIHVNFHSRAASDAMVPSAEFLRGIGPQLRERGIVYQVLPWGKNDVQAYKSLLDLGVMSFATDEPDVTTQAIKEYLTAAGER